MKEYSTPDFTKAKVTGGFWLKRQDAVCGESIPYTLVDEKFEKFLNPAEPGSRAWGGGIAKWIEAMSYMLRLRSNEQLRAKIEACIDEIARDQDEDGYIVNFFGRESQKLLYYTNHELYGLGHWIEAALAYRGATGSDRLLNITWKYVELADRVFRVEHSAPFDTPGHEEIELALYKLYRATEDERAMTLMRYFINKRGNNERIQPYPKFGTASHSQAHLPVREQRTAEGHAVRAVYLYCAMADMAAEDNDEGLKEACEALLDNIVNRRMYITGGIGSTYRAEAFTFDYDLMNRTAYTETCASIGLALFARRMFFLRPFGWYGDIVERALLNGTLSGISLDGASFFYENPLEVHPDIWYQNQELAQEREHMPDIARQRTFSCACCPPNIARIIMNISEFAISWSGDTLFLHQYMDFEAEIGAGRFVSQRTAYPFEGKIDTTLCSGEYAVACRIPGWAPTFRLAVNGTPVQAELRDGYASLRRRWEDGDVLSLELPLTVRCEEAHPAVHDDCGRLCVSRGPLVYCLEEKDNGRWLKDIAIAPDAVFAESYDETLEATVLTTEGTRRIWPDPKALYAPAGVARARVTVRFVPYFAWANRGEGEMIVWVQAGEGGTADEDRAGQ